MFDEPPTVDVVPPQELPHAGRWLGDWDFSNEQLAIWRQAECAAGTNACVAAAAPKARDRAAPSLAKPTGPSIAAASFRGGIEGFAFKTGDHGLSY